tara:strand:+ start:208 stop:516 length:309 start_codon:yes stop_codon:yes gene_type:complete
MFANEFQCFCLKKGKKWNRYLILLITLKHFDVQIHEFMFLSSHLLRRNKKFGRNNKKVKRNFFSSSSKTLIYFYYIKKKVFFIISKEIRDLPHSAAAFQPIL